MELINILKILRRWLWLMFSIVLVTALGLILWSRSEPLTYEARVKLQLSAPQQEDVAAYDQYRSISLRDEITIAKNNFIEIVQDSKLRDDVVILLNLSEEDADYELEVAPERDTDYINVVVGARTPQLAVSIANTLVDKAIIYSGELRAKPTNAEKSLYYEQMMVAEDAYRSAENAITEFKIQSGISSLAEEISSTQAVLKSLKIERDQRALDDELYQNDLINKIDAMIVQYQDELNRLVALEPMYSLLEDNAQQARDEYRQILNQPVSTSAIEAAEAKYHDTEEAFADFKSQNNVTFLQTEVDLTQQLLEQLRLDRDQRVLEAPTFSTIDALIVQRQMELDRLEALKPIYNLMEENAEGARAKYQHVLDKYSEAALKAAVVQAANYIQVVHSAEIPQEPVNNSKTLLVLGITGSLGFGVLLAFFLEYITGASRDTKIVDQVDSRSVLGYQVLGAVPIMRDGLYRPDMPEADAIRHLRTAILLSSPNRSVKKILVTSPLPGDGKTFISANLGAVQARSGSNVVLVDSDLRNPSLHETFDAPNLKGITNLLESDDPRLALTENHSQYLHPTSIQGVSLLSAGKLPKDPSLLLTSPNLSKIIDDLVRQFDFVLVDSPPILTAPDASILANAVDGIIIVLNPNTGSSVVQEAIDTLCQKEDVPILGFILNRTSPNLYPYPYYGYRAYSSGSTGTKLPFLEGLRKSPDPDLISEAQASKILGIQLDTTKRWRREERLPVVKIGLWWWVREDELRDQFGIESQKSHQTSSPSFDSMEATLNQRPRPGHRSAVTRPVARKGRLREYPELATKIVKMVEDSIRKIQYRFGKNNPPVILRREIPKEQFREKNHVARENVELPDGTDLKGVEKRSSVADTTIDEESVKESQETR